MTDKLKVSAVSYLNTKPFLYGLEQTGLIKNMELSLDIPSKTAQKLLSREVDLGLIPVGILPQLNDYQLVTDYCIGTNGAVKTVCLYSQLPLHKIKKIYLDYHSCTSVRLVQVLCKYYWNLAVIFIPATPGFEKEIKGETAGVVIGDRTIKLDRHFSYKYDLGQHWYDFTKLPFVFAAWVSISPLPKKIVDSLNNSFALGTSLKGIQAVAKQYQSNYDSSFDIEKYLAHFINYSLGVNKQAALQLFLKYVMEIELLSMSL